jgi:hypothetical protein
MNFEKLIGYEAAEAASVDVAKRLSALAGPPGG